MIYAFMKLMSNNPAGGPLAFGILWDLLIIILMIGTRKK